MKAACTASSYVHLMKQTYFYEYLQFFPIFKYLGYTLKGLKFVVTPANVDVACPTISIPDLSLNIIFVHITGVSHLPFHQEQTKFPFCLIKQKTKTISLASWDVSSPSLTPVAIQKSCSLCHPYGS